MSETLARANVVLIFSIGYAILQYELASGNGRTRTVLKDTLRVQHLKVLTRVGIILRKKSLKDTNLLPYLFEEGAYYF